MKSKIFAKNEKGKLVLDPVKDFLQLRGSLQANKKLDSKQLRNAFIAHLAKRHTK